MANLILIFLCLFIGVVLQRAKALPKDTHVALNMVILYVPLPALALLSLPSLQWNADLIALALSAWIVFGCAYFFFSFFGKRFNWDPKLTGCLILTAGLGNTAFVGFPVIEALYGKEGLKFALLVDQPGSFLICSSLGIWVATRYAAGGVPKRELLKRVLIFPPFIGFLVAILLGAIGWEARGTTQVLLERLASTLTPLALISVGLQLKARDIRGELSHLGWGLGFKLLIAPTVIFAAYAINDVPQNVFRVAVMESAMAPMITGSILAASYNLHPRLAGLMVGVGVPLSFLTLFAWYQFL